ncbi:MAG: DUF3124 domain-containing protein [Cyclobacteriaceae bacterium]|nr:DUF3124 domain-containing protein [Cyclobacteriaceae bacterium SS2]
MKKNIYFLLLILLFMACEDTGEVSSVNPVNWETRTLKDVKADSLKFGSSYLSVYSHIYSETEHKTHPLTGTVSIRNANRADSIYIMKAEYFDTSGELIRTYFDKPIFLKPMETVEIVIDQEDKSGGSGANFIFDWLVKPGVHKPIFECVMISTYGQQGLSFMTHGYELEK